MAPAPRLHKTGPVSDQTRTGEDSWGPTLPAEHRLPIDSGRREVIVFSQYAVINSFKSMVSQTSLLKFNGTQNKTKRHQREERFVEVRQDNSGGKELRRSGVKIIRMYYIHV